MWPEILTLSVQDVETITLVTVFFICRQPRHIKDLNEMSYVVFFEYRGIEDSGDGPKVEGTGDGGLGPGGSWGGT